VQEQQPGVHLFDRGGNEPAGHHDAGAAGAFSPYEVGGYWVTEQPVEATERVTIDGPLARHAAAGIELRVVPSIWPFWRRVTASTVEFSASRLRNAADHPERMS
jgi:hypothetical protein